MLANWMSQQGKLCTRRRPKRWAKEMRVGVGHYGVDGPRSGLGLWKIERYRGLDDY